jgi:hypothetical protein
LSPHLEDVAYDQRRVTIRKRDDVALLPMKVAPRGSNERQFDSNGLACAVRLPRRGSNSRAIRVRAVDTSSSVRE